MLIWLVKIGEPVSPVPSARRLRTGLLAEALAARGHQVVWWTSAFDHHQKKMVFKDGERVRLSDSISAMALRGMAYRHNVSPQRYIDHALIARKFRRLSEAFPPPDIIVAAMPDYQLAAEAVRYGKRHSIPVVVDVRDKWPDFFWETAPRWAAPMVKTLLLRDRRLLAQTFKNATAITSVTETWLTWALDQAGRQRQPRDGVFFLGALPHETPPLLEDSVPMKKLRELTRGRFVVSFIGTFSKIHNPLVAIRAARRLRNYPHLFSRLLFVLAGDGPLWKEALRLSKGLDQVVLPGWLNATEINLLLSLTSVGLVPFGFSGDLFPNKAFTFFSAGVPVLTSGKGDLRSLILDHEAGGLFDGGNPESLLTQIERWAADQTAFDAARRNARRLFEERLNAGPIYTDFVKHIETLAVSPCH